MLLPAHPGSPGVTVDNVPVVIIVKRVRRGRLRYCSRDRPGNTRTHLPQATRSSVGPPGAPLRILASPVNHAAVERCRSPVPNSGTSRR